MNDSRIFVKPKKGLEVQKCFADFGRKELISLEGEHVPNTIYYRRLIKRGELVVSKPTAPKNKQQTTKNGGK